MNRKRQIILLKVSGDDKPGLTSALTGVLAQYGASILDIGQSVIHDELGLGILFEVSDKYESSPVLKELLFKGYELNTKVKFELISQTEYEEWVSKQKNSRYIVTLLGKQLTALQLSKVTQVVSDEKLNIDNITRLSGRVDLDSENSMENSVIQFALSGNLSHIDSIKASFVDISQHFGIDISFQEDNIYRRIRRMVCFDMDSTLIQAEVIDELAKYAGVGEQVSAITEQAMGGEIDFSESFKRRIKLLDGIDESVLAEIAENLPLTDGAERLFKTLKKYGYKTAILSGGFTYFGKFLQDKLGIDYVYANELEIVDGKLTGDYLGEIVDGARKAAILNEIATKEGIHLDQVIAVGDGSNDLPMLSEAGLGIAFHAKPIVKENAEHSISSIGLDAILYLMGFRDRDIE